MNEKAAPSVPPFLRLRPHAGRAALLAVNQISFW
jgi:hypothetical protein